MSLATHCFVLATAFCAGPVLSIAAAEPDTGDLVLVIAAPFADMTSLVDLSGGRIVGPNTGVIGALAISDSPAFFETLKENGAWGVADGNLIAQLCGIFL